MIDLQLLLKDYSTIKIWEKEVWGEWGVEGEISILMEQYHEN